MKIIGVILRPTVSTVLICSCLHGKSRNTVSSDLQPQEKQVSMTNLQFTQKVEETKLFQTDVRLIICYVVLL